MAGQADEERSWRNSRWRVAAWGAAGAVLLAPLAAMQVTDEVAWGPMDFLLAGGLVGSLGLAWELAARKSSGPASRAGAAVALAAAFLLVWINVAVGMIGDEGNPANWMYAAVLAVALGGAVLARFQPRGLARAMTAAAVVQALVPLVAQAAGLGSAHPIAIAFAAPWLLSAWLFHLSSRR